MLENPFSLLSIIIPFPKETERLDFTLNSIAKEFSCFVEIIILNNDHQKEILEKFNAYTHKENKNMRILYFQDLNNPISHTLQQALKIASGQSILLIHPGQEYKDRKKQQKTLAEIDINFFNPPKKEKQTLLIWIKKILKPPYKLAKKYLLKKSPK